METYKGTESLKTIYNEVDNTETKVIVSTQCMKAQTYLVNKLKTKGEQYKERCSSFCTANLKIESEIKEAQRGIASMIKAQDTIKTANVELKKELLLTKENKIELTERLHNGEKKYEDLWLESKARYESLPFVQKLLKSKNDVQNIKQQINELENYEKIIYVNMKAKAETCREIDRKRIIELAEFMVVEMPKTINMIKEKSAAVRVLEEQLDNLGPKTDDQTGNNGDLKPDNDCTSFMPKLQLNYFDFDNLNANLDQIKGDDSFIKTPEKTYSVHSIIVIDPSKICKKKSPSTKEYISSFFYKPMYEANKTQNYAKKKLINILEDMKIDRNETQRMISYVNPAELQPVDSISIKNLRHVEKNEGILKNKGANLEMEEIEEINMSASVTDQMLMPPTQFLDTPEIWIDDTLKISQEEPTKKKVKFDLSINTEPMTMTDAEKPNNEGEIVANETINSQLDIGDADDGLASMKDMIMKKHNLDLSPQFVYTKNVMTPLNLKKAEDAVVTSEFFPQKQNQNNTEEQPEVIGNTGIEEDHDITAKEVTDCPMDIDNEPAKITVPNIRPEGVSSPKKQNVSESTQSEQPISGFMFGRSTQMTCDFLEESTNNTVFEDGDYASCLDSSLLHSPKADLSMPNMETQELSLDVPNFLSGLRKTGMSFFGQFSSDSGGQNQSDKEGTSGFNFNFGGEEKKSRGGLFSMFK